MSHIGEARALEKEAVDLMKDVWHLEEAAATCIKEAKLLREQAEELFRQAEQCMNAEDRK